MGGWAAAALLGGMALLIAGDVALRSVNLGSLPWSVEVAEYILFTATFLAAPWVLQEGGHVRVDIVVRMLPAGWGSALDRLAAAIGLVVCGFLIYYGSGSAWEAYRLDSLIFKQLVVAEWWLLALIPVTGLLLGIEFLMRLLGTAPTASSTIGTATGDSPPDVPLDGS